MPMTSSRTGRDNADTTWTMSFRLLRQHPWSSQRVVALPLYASIERLTRQSQSLLRLGLQERRPMLDTGLN